MAGEFIVCIQLLNGYHIHTDYTLIQKTIQEVRIERG
jgi:hypothetical protein